MSFNARRTTRAACAAGVAALAVVMHFGLGSRPVLVGVADPAEAPPEALAFAEPADADLIPGVQVPELLGLEVAQSDVEGFSLDLAGPTAANPAITAELEHDALESSTEAATTEAQAGETGAGGESRSATDAGVEAAGSAEQADDLGAPRLSVDVEVVPGAGASTEASPFWDAETEAGSGAVEGPADSFPAPPPAAGPTPPRYGDPSGALISASGRPFDVPPSVSRSLSGISDDEVRVAGLVSRSLAGFEFRPEVCAGARARFGQANAHDELTRAVVFDACRDDAGQAGTAARLAADLAEDDIFAVVPLSSSAFFAAETLTEATIPYIGGADLPAFCGRGTPLGFGIQGAVDCPVLDARGYALLAQPVLTALAATWGDEPGRDVAYLVEAGPRGESIIRSRSFEADLLGWEPVTFFASIPTPADGPVVRWPRRVGDVLASQPDVVIIEGRNTDGLPEALRDEGFEGEIVFVGLVDPLDVADTEARLRLAPLTVVSQGIDAASRASDGWAALAGAAAAVGRGPEQIGLDFIEGYVAADMFVQALAASPEPLTAATFARTINDGWWYPGVNGVACGSWWPASHLAPSPCVSIARVDYFTPHLVPVLGLVETAPQLRFELG